MKRSGRPRAKEGRENGRATGTITDDSVEQLPMTRGRGRPGGTRKTDNEEVDHVDRSARFRAAEGAQKPAAEHDTQILAISLYHCFMDFLVRFDDLYRSSMFSK